MSPAGERSQRPEAGSTLSRTYSIRLEGRVHTTVPGRLASSGSGDRRLKRLGRRRLCRVADQGAVSRAGDPAIAANGPPLASPLFASATERVFPAYAREPAKIEVGGVNLGLVLDRQRSDVGVGCERTAHADRPQAGQQ